jgi:hypothetical protein
MITTPVPMTKKPQEANILDRIVRVLDRRAVAALTAVVTSDLNRIGTDALRAGPKGRRCRGRLAMCKARGRGDLAVRKVFDSNLPDRDAIDRGAGPPGRLRSSAALMVSRRA